MTPIFFDEESKTGLGFEIELRHRKCQRKPSLQLLAHPAVPLPESTRHPAGAIPRERGSIIDPGWLCLRVLVSFHAQRARATRSLLLVMLLV